MKLKTLVYFNILILSQALAFAGNSHSCKNVLQTHTQTLLQGEYKNPFDQARITRDSSNHQSNKLLDKIEKTLQTDEVVKIEDLGGGVNASYKITFASGLKAAYKPVNPDRPNQPIREAVAYRLSRLLGLDIVPPTVVRKLSGNIPSEFKNTIGSVQLFISTAKPLEKGKDSSSNDKILLFDQKPFDPDTTLSGRRLRIFDWLINNHDRGSNAGNYLVSKIDGYIIGIDHSVSFVGHDKAARKDKVPYYKLEFLNDAEFYQKLTSAPPEQIKAALEGLNPVRVEEFFQRYHQLISDFKKVLK